MKKVFVILGVVIILIIIAIFALRIFSDEDTWICQNGEWVKHGHPKAEKPTTNCGNIIKNNNQAEEQVQPVEEANIVVFSPKENAKISSPFEVEGKARVFENVVSIKLKSESGKILFQGTTDAQSPDMGKFGLFQEEIKYTTSETKGTLEVFESSAKDGSEINKVTVPVKFAGENNPDETDGN